MKYRPYPIFLALSIAFFACDSNPGSPGNTTSGIEGAVLRGPICPVIQEGDPCPDEPFAALFDVLDQSETKISSFTTGADGTFKIGLAAGEYLIVPDETAPVINPASQKKNVTVVAEQFTTITLEFDTGIR